MLVNTIFVNGKEYGPARFYVNGNSRFRIEIPLDAVGFINEGKIREILSGDNPVERIREHILSIIMPFLSGSDYTVDYMGNRYDISAENVFPSKEDLLEKVMFNLDPNDPHPIKSDLDLSNWIISGEFYNL